MPEGIYPYREMEERDNLEHEERGVEISNSEIKKDLNGMEKISENLDQLRDTFDEYIKIYNSAQELGITLKRGGAFKEFDKFENIQKAIERTKKDFKVRITAVFERLPNKERKQLKEALQSEGE